MSNEIYIFEATANNFQNIVIENSNKLPVFVEFMGVWSEHCFAVEALFSSLAKEFSGRFIFAKVDVDEQIELKDQYNIENVPTIIVFRDGEVVRVDMGELSEEEARALLREFGVSHATDELRAQAREKHLAGDVQGAIVLLSDAIRTNPSDTRVAMDMVQIFIDIGNVEDAVSLFNRLPDKDKESDMGKVLVRQLTFIDLASKTPGKNALEERLKEDGSDHKARFDLAVCLIAKHDYQTAMDHLLEVLNQAPDFSDGAARELMIVVLRFLTPIEPELAQTYQRKFSSQVS